MLELLKLLHFGSNSDSKMIEARNGVSTKLKKLNPFMNELDANFILATKFFANILLIILALCKIFLSDYVALLDVHQELNKAINYFTIEFIGYPNKNINATLETRLYDYCIQYLIDTISSFIEEFANAIIINL
ncbi:hypothetical protein F8M41_021685 [Gigaspora margarita]|uniref:Uncharacterized protein n=1 Tax=Gigaspora margarita TaxID=4874 RepID=A0A8H4EIL8_GIGMA|nr:hypothetical protein F8M41_021685 [Gigaspora margarita]